MTDESVRDLLVEAVKARFEMIKPGKVFVNALTERRRECTTNIGQVVIPWHKGEMRRNGIVFRDENDEITVEGVEDGKDEHRLHFTAEAYLLEGTGTAAMGRQAIRDVLAAIFSDHQWGGLARYTEPVSTSLGIEQAGKIVGGGIVEFAVVYRAPYGEI